MKNPQQKTEHFTYTWNCVKRNSETGEWRKEHECDMEWVCALSL